MIIVKKMYTFACLGLNRVREKTGDQQIVGSAVFITSVALPAEKSYDCGRGRRGRAS